MSFCCNATRSGDNSASIEYLRTSSLLLKSQLQCWIASVLAAGWMPIDPISETIEDNGILYPLGKVHCDFKGKLSFHKSIYYSLKVSSNDLKPVFILIISEMIF